MHIFLLTKLIFIRDLEAVRGHNLIHTLQIEPVVGQRQARRLRQASVNTSIHMALSHKLDS